MAPVVGIAYCLVIVQFGLRGAFGDNSPISKLRFHSPTDESDGESICMTVAFDAVYPGRKMKGTDGKDAV